MSELKNVVVSGMVTGTSKKENGKFKQDTQTAYIRPASEKDAQALINFGLREYTSKEGEKFFIIKTPLKGIQVWCAGEKVDQLETTLNDPTLSTDFIKLNILKGESELGNTFFRLGSILVETADQIHIAQETNPFA